MLYRLRPKTPLEWSDFPGFDMFDEAVRADADFDRLEWDLTEERVFSNDLLRIALRHGVATRTGIVVSAARTVDLGRSDTIQAFGLAADEAQAELRDSHGALMEHLMPGWTRHGDELDQRVRESIQQSARDAEEDLAEVLAAPVNPALISHWIELGGDPLSEY
jgi:hypothetical protein